MKKKMIALAVAGAFAAPLAVQAAGVEVSGFADILYNFKDEAADPAPSAPPGTKNTKEKKFSVNAEVDVIGSLSDNVTVRIDMDGDVMGSGAGNVTFEQAYAAWGVTEQVGVMAGIFNNPIGYDEEDKPDIDFITHNSIFNILDNQTALGGNNIAGVAVSGGNNMFTLGVAYLNDIQQVDEENSVAVFGNLMPMQDVELEFGYVTQDNDNPAMGGAGNVWDINGQWGNIMGSGVAVGAEYLGTDEVLDGAWNVWAGVDFAQGFALKGRYESSASDLTGVDDSTRYSIYGSWNATQNVKVALEYTQGDTDQNSTFDAVTGINDGKLVQLQILATMP
ncbi:MAG TPA: porin [Gammaproteobacteria bacterium]|nr:porin [Gammaproteobacteria bacterium]